MSKRTDILNTALALFNAYGYIAVGVDRIRDEANASKMTLYKYFPSKEALIKEVLALRHAQLEEAMTQAMAMATAPKEQLRRLFQWHRYWFSQPEFHGCMFIKARDEHPEHAAIIDAARQHKCWLTALIAQRLAAIGLSNSEQHAIALCAQLDGAIIHAALFSTPQSADHAWHVACCLLGETPDALGSFE